MAQITNFDCLHLKVTQLMSIFEHWLILLLLCNGTQVCRRIWGVFACSDWSGWGFGAERMLQPSTSCSLAFFTNRCSIHLRAGLYMYMMRGSFHVVYRGWSICTAVSLGVSALDRRPIMISNIQHSRLGGLPAQKSDRNLHNLCLSFFRGLPWDQRLGMSERTGTPWLLVWSFKWKE